MSLCVAIKSCHKDMDRGCHDAIRETWGKDLKALGVSVVFFMGADPAQQSTRQVRRYQNGEVVLDCSDDYMELCQKTKRICRWVTGKRFEHIFLCDNDTFLKANRLVTSGFEPYDYSGYFKEGYPNRLFRYDDARFEIQGLSYSWASGGVGYFLSRRACDNVSTADVVGKAEDHWIGQVMAAPENKLKIGVLQNFNAEVSWHLPKFHLYMKYEPDYMRGVYHSGGTPEQFMALAKGIGR